MKLLLAACLLAVAAAEPDAQMLYTHPLSYYPTQYYNWPLVYKTPEMKEVEEKPEEEEVKKIVPYYYNYHPYSYYNTYPHTYR